MSTWSNKNFRDMQSENESQESIVIKGKTVFLNASYTNEDGVLKDNIQGAVAAVADDGIYVDVINFKTPNTTQEEQGDSGVDTSEAEGEEGVPEEDTEVSVNDDIDNQKPGDYFIQIRRASNNDILIMKG